MIKRLFFSYGFYILIFLLIIIFTLISNHFMSVSNWTQISIASCFLLTAAAGLTVVLITGNIDLSVGSIAYIAASVAYLSADQGPIITILAVIFVGAFLGLINGFLIAYLKMNSLLTTLGLLIAYRGISLVITGGTVQKIGETIVL